MIFSESYGDGHCLSMWLLAWERFWVANDQTFNFMHDFEEFWLLQSPFFWKGSNTLVAACEVRCRLAVCAAWTNPHFCTNIIDQVEIRDAFVQQQFAIAVDGRRHAGLPQRLRREPRLGCDGRHDRLYDADRWALPIASRRDASST